MKLMKMILNVGRYLSEAALRIFGPNKDDYPATGAQPFTGDPYKERSGKH